MVWLNADGIYNLDEAFEHLDKATVRTRYAMTNFASEATVDGQLPFKETIRVGATPTGRTNLRGI
jgi:hypothetical protein